jgi:hypothetical protein
MISLNNQNKEKKVHTSIRNSPNSVNQTMTGMTEKKLAKINTENLSNFPLWDKVLSNIEKAISKPSFDTWLKDTYAKQLDKDTIIIFSQNDFQASWLEERYRNLIIDALKEVSEITFNIEFRF